MSLVTVLLIVLLVLLLTGVGGWGYSRSYGPGSFGPLGLVLVILLILLLTGYIG